MSGPRHCNYAPDALPRCASALFAIAWIVSVSVGLAGTAEAGPNGFDVSRADIPTREILRGGPPRDGIPALDAPSMEIARDAKWPDDTMVVGVALTGEDGVLRARAYPIPILMWHELVNDRIGDRPILVSYCPLCASAMIFDRSGSDESPDRFGVSGLLYQSDLLMFDRRSESLWTQIGARAVTGPRAGERLPLIRSSQERWATWRRRHPDGLVLSRKTGHRRNYDRSPYAGYAESKQLFFPVSAADEKLRRFHPKTRTLGLRTAEGNEARAYPLPTLVAANGSITGTFAGHPVTVSFDDERSSFEVQAPAEIQFVDTYWFAWITFHPHSAVAAREAGEQAGK